MAALTLAAGFPSSARAQSTIFTANEVRATKAKDYLRDIRATLKDGTEAGRKLTARTSDAFNDTPDWAKATENYYSLRRQLIARSGAIEARLDKNMAANTSLEAEKVRDLTDDLIKEAELLRSDYEFYVRLPALAAGPQRKAAQASMRLLSQTGKYPLALAYYLDKATDRRPFSPLSAPLTLVRLPY